MSDALVLVWLVGVPVMWGFAVATDLNDNLNFWEGLGVAAFWPFFALALIGAYIGDKVTGRAA